MAFHHVQRGGFVSPALFPAASAVWTHGRAQVLKKNGGIKIPIEGLLTEVDLSDFCGYLTKLEVDVSDFSG